MPTFFINSDSFKASNAFVATLGAAPGSTYLGQIIAAGLPTAANAMLAAMAATTAQTRADAIAANLGLTGTAATTASNYLQTVAFAGAASTHGQGLLTALDLFTTLQNDATFGTAATAYVARVNTALSYSSVAANNSTDLTTLAAAVGSAGSSGAGSTFTLTDSSNTTTNGVDNINGTAGNDTILGTVSLTNAAAPVLGGSYNVFDTITAGTGTDTLSITVTGGGTTVANASTIPAATISGIEAVTIRNTATGSTTAALNDAGVTYAGSSGITTYTSDRSTDFVAFTNVASGSTIAINGTGTTTTAQGATSATFATGATTATVRFSNGTGTSGANNSGDVTIGSGLTSLTVNSTGAANAAGTLTTSNATNTTSVTIDATTNLTLAALTGYSTASAASLTVSGAGLVTITGALDATLDTITATSNTGGVSVTLGAGTTAFTGGSGNDTVNTAALAVTAAIAGGDGTDTAVFTASTNYATTATKLTGFETLAVRSAAGGDAYDYSLISGLTGIQVESAGTTTFNNVGATTPIRVTNDVTTALAVNLASTSGTSDAVSITIDDRDTTAAAITIGAISAAGVETLNIVSGDALTAGTPHVISALTSSTGLTTINVSGTSDLTITDATVPTGALTIDGSTMTTRLTVGAAATSGISAGDTVKGGSAIDNLFVNFAALGTTTGFQAGAGDDTLTVFGNGSDIVDGDFAAITGVDNLTVTSATATTVTLGGFAQAAIATVDANTDGRLDFTATALTTASTIDGSALTSRGVDYVVTLTNANGGGNQALAVLGGSIADTFTITADDTADNNDNDNLTVSITGGNGIDTISLTQTAGDAADVATIVITATSLANSDIITGFTANAATSVIDYNGTIQGNTDTGLTSNATLTGALQAATGQAYYVQTTDIANSGSNTQGSAFAAVLGASATTLAANYAALEEQLLATGGALNGTITGLDAAIANNTASLIVLDNGTGSVVLRLLNTTTVANTITAAEIDLVAVLTNAHGLTALDFV